MKLTIENGVLTQAILDAGETHVTVPEGVTSLGRLVFLDCKHALRSVTLPDTLTEIGGGAFLNCAQLREIVFPPHLKRIGEAAFQGSGITRAMLPDSLEELGRQVFLGCENLREVRLPARLKRIGPENFLLCPALTGVWCDAPDLPLFKPQGLQIDPGSTQHIVEGFLPGDELQSLHPRLKPVAVACYLSSRERYSPEKQAQYDAYITHQRSRLLRIYVQRRQTQVAERLLSACHFSAQVIEQALLTAQNDPALTALLRSHHPDKSR